MGGEVGSRKLRRYGRSSPSKFGSDGEVAEKFLRMGSRRLRYEASEMNSPKPVPLLTLRGEVWRIGQEGQGWRTALGLGRMRQRGSVIPRFAIFPGRGILIIMFTVRIIR